MLKIEMKNTFTTQLIQLRAMEDSQNHELADHIQSTYNEAICSHDYLPRKVLYGKENSVQYEFLCPVSRAIMMIYKGSNTFDGYDFAETHPNPRLREMVKHNPELAEKHGFEAK